MFGIGGNDYSALKTAIHRFQRCLALQFETNAALDQFRAEASLA
jgi:hypothetical protein